MIFLGFKYSVVKCSEAWELTKNISYDWNSFNRKSRDFFLNDKKMHTGWAANVNLNILKLLQIIGNGNKEWKIWIPLIYEGVDVELLKNGYLYVIV